MSASAFTSDEQEKIWNSWLISEDDMIEFRVIFEQVDSDKDGFIKGDQAKTLFASSGVPFETLGKIWSLADRNKDKQLDQREYALAMFLIRKKQRGEALPPQLPDNLVWSVYPETAPNGWVQQYMTPPQTEASNSSDAFGNYKTIPDLLQDSGVTTVSTSPPGTPSLYSSNGSVRSSGHHVTYGEMPPPGLRNAQYINNYPNPPDSPEVTPKVSHPNDPPYSLISNRSPTPPPTYDNVQKSRDPSELTGWMACTTDDGKTYYFNRTTGATQWEKPADFDAHNNPLNPKTEKLPPPPVESVVQIQQNPEMREFFKQFLDSQEATAEFAFFVAVEDFKREISGSLKIADIVRADNIYNKFIARGSPFAINIPAVTVKKLDKIFQKGEKNQEIEVDSTIFDEAKDAIYRNLEKEQLPKFMKSMFYISMYNSMMNKKTYELPEQVWKEFLVASEGGVEDNWSYVMEKKGILVHKKQYKNTDMICVRGSGVVPLPLEEMLTFCTSIKLREHWDNLFKNGKIAERFDEKTIILVYEYRSPKWAPMYSPHDYVIMRTEKSLPDGTKLVLSRSVIHKDYPPRKGFIRSEVDVSGFVLKPCGTNSTVVIYVAQSKINGVPKWAEHKLLFKRALFPNVIRKYVEKELKDKKKVPAWKQDDLW